MEDTERKLARMSDFKGAADMSSRAVRRRAEEEAAHEQIKGEMGLRPRQVLVQTQEGEMRHLLQKCHSLRVAAKREKDAAFEALQQKYRNLEADLEHAHKVEFSLRAEIGAVQSHKSRSKQASTFRGTLKYESLAGTKFDVPAVSSLPPIPADEAPTSGY